MTIRNKPAVAGALCGLVVAVAAFAPVAAHAQVKPTVTVVNPVSSPVNTRITNPVIPVTISNADPIPVQVQAASAATPLANYKAFRAGTASESNADDFLLRPATEALQITGLVFQVNSRGVSGSCEAHVSVVDPNDITVAGLGSLATIAGRSLSSPAIPFPNLVLPAGYAVKYFLINDTGEFCEADFTLYTIAS